MSRSLENESHILYFLERHTLQTSILVQRIRVDVRRLGRFGMLRSPSEERDHHSGNDKSEPDPKILSHGQSLSENSAFVTEISHQLCRSLTPINYSYRRPSIFCPPRKGTPANQAQGLNGMAACVYIGPGGHPECHRRHGWHWNRASRADAASAI
jgi:hypothetical protein